MEGEEEWKWKLKTEIADVEGLGKDSVIEMR